MDIDHKVYKPLAEFATELFQVTGRHHIDKIVLSGALAASFGSAPGESVRLMTPSGYVDVEFTHG